MRLVREKEYNHRSEDASILEELPSGSYRGGLMVNYIRGQAYDEYLKGDSWRCSNSPTGAHCWLTERNQMVCKYCSKARRI